MGQAPTRVPAVVDTIVSLLRGALPTWEVYDGPPVGSDWPWDFVIVGYGEEDSASSTLTESDGLGDRLVEVFEVNCLASTLSGDAGMAARRAACGALLAAVDEALKANSDLGGACDRVTLGPSLRWAQGQGPDGASCEVAFSVAGRALL